MAEFIRLDGTKCRRYEWACGLAYASWNAEELESIDFRDYYYTTKEMPCA